VSKSQGLPRRSAVGHRVNKSAGRSRALCEVPAINRLPNHRTTMSDAYSTRNSRAFYQSSVFADAMRELRVPFGARLLFEELVRACGKDRRYTWVLQSDLAERFAVTTRTIQRWEKALVRAGLLTTARASLWARWNGGGTRRLAIPHEFSRGAFRCPGGVLDEDGRCLSGEGVTIKAVVAKCREGLVKAMSHQWRKPSSIGNKRKEKGRKRPQTNALRPGERLIPGLCIVRGGNAAVDYAQYLANFLGRVGLGAPE